jgi:uncharacterized repeat protein (TIGR01451 family)
MVLLPGLGWSQPKLLADAILTNQATATFQIGEAAEVYSIVSNVVSVRIEPVEALVLESNQVRLQRAGRWVYFDHTLTNTGNVVSDYEVVFETQPNSSFQFTNLSIQVEDVASKLPAGLIATRSAREERTIAPGQTQAIRAQAFVPLNVTRRDIGRLRLVVQTKVQRFETANFDSVLIQAGTILEITKVNLSPAAVQGEEILYQLTGRNTGDVAALAINHLIDGRPERNVIIRDRIPANTVFNQFVQNGSARPLYHYFGTALHDYRTEPPSDLGEIDAIAWAIPIIEEAGGFSFMFSVTIAPNANGTIANTADVFYNDGLNDDMQASASNQVIQLLPEKNAEIDYFTGIDFNKTTRVAKVGLPLFVQANASACNLNAAWADTSEITITSRVTGDVEKFASYETARNSGVFRILPEVPTRDYLINTPIAGNGILEIARDDELIAELQQCGVVSSTRVQATVWVDPKAIVFDSESNRPVPGSKVTLIDLLGNSNGGQAGGIAMYNDAEGNQSFPAVQTTGEDGAYEMPNVVPGRYRLLVEPPTGYAFPSALAPAQLPSTRSIDAKASYGQDFNIAQDLTPVAWDVPVDVNGIGALKMEKIANRPLAEVGDQVGYTIRITNMIFSTIQGVVVDDKIPYGFSYVKGTARVDSQRIADPVSSGGIYRFQAGDVEPGKTITLQYRLRVGPLAVNGDGENTAIASAPELIEKLSNSASVKVVVHGGLFADETYVVGKVYHDRNQNGTQEKDEPGIPGVRLYLENGNFISTDAYGRYTFFGLPARKHVLKLDVESLPKGARLEVLDQRHAFDASSRFVDVRKGEIHKADFAVCSCEGEIDDEVLRRREALLVVKDDWATAVEQRLEAASTGNQRDRRMLPSQGLVNGAQPVRFDPVTASDPNALGKSTLEMPVQAPGLPAIEDVITQLNNKLGFVDFTGNDTLPLAQATVRIKGRANSNFLLYVDSVEVSEDRVGKRAATETVEAWEYIGVKFKSGPNTLKIVTIDPFGNRRDSISKVVIAPGTVSKITVKSEEDGVAADGVSAVKVHVSPLDEHGVPVKARVFVTLDVSAGTWNVKDMDPRQPGTQVIITNGIGRFDLISPAEPADVTVRASNGSVKGETTLTFVPDLRSLIAAGIIEGTIRLRNRSVIQGITNDDGFEHELREWSTGANRLTADARLAFFLKGKVKGNYLLTAGFDSEKDNAAMFRDIQPDEYYPVYGEASMKGFDAQSTGRLFVRVERNKSFALYGDYTTTEMHPAQMLGAYNRNLTGAKWHWERSRFRANAWLSQATSNQVFEELPALGISGPYALRFSEMIINSEKVEVITRDRNQPDVIIKVEQMTRFTDYTIEPFTGALMFRGPVRSVDEELNPRYIRIIYEVRSALDRYMVGGGDVQFKVTNNIELGATATEDRNPTDAYSLRSANATVKLGAATVIAEVAQSDRESKGSDEAARVEMRVQAKKGDGRIFAGKAGERFDNPFSTIAAARTEGGLRGSYQLGNATMLQAEAIFSRNDTTDVVRSGGFVRVQRNIAKNLQLELGARHMQEDTNQTSTIRTRLTARMARIAGLQGYGEYEQSIAATERRIAAMGGEYQMGSRGRVYARHEFLSSIRGPYTLNETERQNNTMIGLDASYMKNGQVFSEYRVREGMDGRQAQAAMGLRNRFQIAEGFGLTTSIERVYSVAGRAANEGTAISVGADYTRAVNWKATGRQEVRFGPQGNMALNTLGYGRRLTKDWAFLGKNILAVSDDKAAGRRVQERLRLGMAYRDAETSVWNALFRYELKLESQELKGDASSRTVHMFSNHTSWQATERLVFSTQAAAKHSRESFDGMQSANVMELLGLRMLYDIGKRWDAGVQVSMLANEDFSMRKTGLGAEVGLIVATNLRLAAGYNVFGYRDRDLTEMEYTDPGAYLGFAYKFDERAIQNLLRQKAPKLDVYEPCLDPGQPCSSKLETRLMRLPEVVIDSLPFTPLQPFALSGFTAGLPSSIHFALNQSFISAASARMLDRIADYMHEHPEQKLTLLGHTDSRNTFDYNLKLSMRRADAAKSYLIAAGISADRVTTEAKSKNELAIKEESLVNEAENRRVEFKLTPERPGVRMINQIEDIQNETRELPDYEEWGFLVYTSHNAVPDRVNFEDNSDRLSQYIRIALDRVVLVMDRDTSLRLKLVTYANTPSELMLMQKRLTAIMELMEDEKIELGRITVENLNFNAGAMNPDEVASLKRSVYFEFGTPNRLVRMFQKKDVLGAHADKVPKAVYRVVELQKNRSDYAILGDRKPSHFVPSAVHFDAASEKVDHKSQAVIARVASYLVANRHVTVTLSGLIDSDTPIGQASATIARRAELVKKLLTGAGVEDHRIVLNTDVELSAKVEASEQEKAAKRVIRFQYSGSDVIKTVDQKFDLKVKSAPPAAPAVQPNVSPRSPQ